MSEHAHTQSMGIPLPCFSIIPLTPSSFSLDLILPFQVLRHHGPGAIHCYLIETAQCLLSVARGLLWQEAGQRNAHSLWGGLGEEGQPRISAFSYLPTENQKRRSIILTKTLPGRASTHTRGRSDCEADQPGGIQRLLLLW